MKLSARYAQKYTKLIEFFFKKSLINIVIGSKIRACQIKDNFKNAIIITRTIADIYNNNLTFKH